MCSTLIFSVYRHSFMNTHLKLHKPQSVTYKTRMNEHQIKLSASLFSVLYDDKSVRYNHKMCKRNTFCYLLKRSLQIHASIEVL